MCLFIDADPGLGRAKEVVASAGETEMLMAVAPHEKEGEAAAQPVDKKHTHTARKGGDSASVLRVLHSMGRYRLEA